MPQNKTAIAAQRGTPLWAFKRLREDALVMLMNDLVNAQNYGLTDEQCNQVKLALGQVVNCASAIPDGSMFRRAL
ncbi:MAG: hypothetical protein ACR2G4_06195 [Pyrinomonadaceae bacterium]